MFAILFKKPEISFKQEIPVLPQKFTEFLVSRWLDSVLYGAVWRVAFAFEPERAAILLAAGDKAGQNQARFYGRLIRTADARFRSHLDRSGKRTKR